MKKGTKLSKKQKGFVKDYVKTGNATEAAKRNYKVANRHTAKVIGSENLSKPIIQRAIADALPDELLSEVHLGLLTSSTIQQTQFSKAFPDELIIQAVQSIQGCKVLSITKRFGEKYVVYSSPDNNSRDKALDKAYKLKGSYAPDKSAVFNFNFDEISAERIKIKNELKHIRKGMVSGNTQTV
jgi:terminase small subunit-like protein